MGNPKRHEGVGKGRSPGTDPQGHRPMRKGGDRQPTRSDFREQAGFRGRAHVGPGQQAESPQQRERDDRRSKDTSGEREGTGAAQRKYGSR